MTAANEATTEAPMTLKQAEEQIALWQDKLQTAQAKLQHHEAQLGQLSLTGGAANAAAELTRLQTDIRVAEQAIAAAAAQREQMRRAATTAQY